MRYSLKINFDSVFFSYFSLSISFSGTLFSFHSNFSSSIFVNFFLHFVEPVRVKHKKNKRRNQLSMKQTKISD